jgi:4-hydroxyproline epimerase
MEIEVIDSHTGGEPTRVVVGGWPMPEGNTVAEKREYMGKHQADWMSGVTKEPRGSDVHVGALLVPSQNPECCTGLIFFTTAGPLGMCGHGTIGVVETLRYLGRIEPGEHKIETAVGIIKVQLEENGTVWVTNVPSYSQGEMCVETDGYGTICGDVVWGGNWFFLVGLNAFTPEVTFENRLELTRFTLDVRKALDSSGVSGGDGEEIDHVEIFGPGTVAGANSKNFVLCPGLDYDRSPCGTGTSAKMASLYEKGELKPGEHWVQESITGTTFTGFVTIEEDKIIPHIAGRAHITGTSTLIFNDNDPFRWGIS